MMSKESKKYVGLCNLKNICYMNSILQQFFMIPAFRYNLLGLEEEQSVLKKNKVFATDDLVLDDMRHQIIRLMSNLEASERNDFNMRGFCYAYKEFDG